MYQALGVGKDERAKSGSAEIGARAKLDGVGGGGTSESFAGHRILASPTLYFTDCFLCPLQFARCQKAEKALHSWGNVYYAFQATLTHMLMHHARSEA